MDIIIASTSLGSMGHCSPNGPQNIMAALREYYDETAQEQEIECTEDNFELNNLNIYQFFEKQDKPFIAIGGDHSITYHIFKAQQEKRRKEGKDDMGLVIFDAHADLMDTFTPPTHEDYLRVLIEEGLVDPQKIVIIGLRNIHSIEYAYLKKKAIKHYPPELIEKEGFQNYTDTITEIITSWKSDFYISFDIDAIDPSAAPGTGYAEPGGLSSREAITMLERLKRSKRFTSADIVEVNPQLDINGKTAWLGAKLLYELAYR
ncbi:MAG: arginase family protein, partial [Nanoarchaeota archaeon]